ncbi:dihydrolipoyllysine-residue succinyltransferase, E2 component of oxoglutarate dehydrogenase (succinyl-transferring) complex [gamma proteobacterium HTCC5015]|nr:dihydrolipoyllysine-residue succinyltransferase, E2 component of oxoglutarate dehydrogenase (succinyl-transferring) complex [gamma proteobacterium HTCC5015]
MKVPQLPESVAEATIAAWHKQPGDAVKRDENLVDIETDKVILEVPAPSDGVLGDILEEVGATVTADQVLAKLEEGEAPAAKEEKASGTKKDAKEETKSDAKADKAESKASQASAQSAEAPREEKAAPGLSPAVRKLVEQHQLDVDDIQGTGKNGRILKEDVMNYIESRPAHQSAAMASQMSDEDKSNVLSPTKLTTEGDRPEKRVPMSRLRQRIAERLVDAQQTAAILTTFNEINMQPVMDLRSKYKEHFESVHGVRLGFMSFFVKAAVEALKRFPEINASIDGEDIVYHGYQDVGVAVSSPRGLLVPVLRNAEHMSMADIEKSISQYGQQAHDGTIDLNDLQGGTFTITNGGVFGSMMSTPILNPPQSAILGMHKTQERPVVENGEIVIRPMMYLALSYDHRIVDGKEAVQFLVTIKELLEEPARIMLNI